MPPVRSLLRLSLLLAALVFTALLASPAESAGGNPPIIVTNNTDVAGSCPGATCTLRAAITKANLGSANTIHFDLPNCPSTPAACVITPTSALPHVTQMTTIIDGTTQTGYTDTPIVVLDGTIVGTAGLYFNADNGVVSGLVIRKFGGNGLVVTPVQHDFSLNFDRFEGNTSGGVNANLDNSLTIDHSTATGNGFYGVFAAYNTMTTAMITNNTITDNQGRGLEITVSGNLTLTNNDISGNHLGLASTGEGVYAVSFTTSNVTFTNNQINYNEADGVVVAVATKLDVTGNQITHNGGMGMDAQSNTVTDATLTSNEISANGDIGAKLAVSNSLAAENNVFTGNTMAGLESTIFTTSNVSVTHNDFLSNESGALFLSASTSAIHFNRFVGNVDSGVSRSFGPDLDATDNWWGCNEGPLMTGCDNAFGANYDPWLVLGLDAAPNSVPPGGQSIITADVTHDSDGADTTGDGHLRDNHISVLFATDLGNIDGSAQDQGVLSSGKSTDGFNAPGSPGIAHVSVTLDNETVTVPITIAGPATPSPTPSPTPTPSGSATASPSPTASPTATPPGSHTQGDTNCDGHIDGADGLPPLIYAAGVQLVSVTGTCPPIASGDPPFGDVNCDGAVDEMDVIAILQYAAELSINPPQPGGCTPLGSALT